MKKIAEKPTYDIRLTIDEKAKEFYMKYNRYPRKMILGREEYALLFKEIYKPGYPAPLSYLGIKIIIADEDSCLTFDLEATEAIK